MEKAVESQEAGNGLNNDLLQAMLLAPEDRKQAALRVLRGESEVDAHQTTGPEPYLTLKEIGRRLNVSPCSLWRWGVPGHALGGRRRFRISEVQAYLESDAFRVRAEQLKDERRREEDAAHGRDNCCLHV